MSPSLSISAANTEKGSLAKPVEISAASNVATKAAEWGCALTLLV